MSGGARGPRTLLVSMPFGALDRPALGLSLLAARARADGVACDVRYLGFDLAAAIGVHTYQWIVHVLPYEAFVGEWLFTAALHGPRPEEDRRYVSDLLLGRWGLSAADVSTLLRVRDACTAYVESCARRVAWYRYEVVGFTSTFHQNIASLALAKRVKSRHPDVTTVFGGANWEGDMGVALSEAFGFVDVVCQGEADLSLPQVLGAVASGSAPSGVPGVVHRTAGGLQVTPSAPPLRDLDALPVPDFSDYFHELAHSQAADAVAPTLLLETSRGCWWGDRSHCTFCGLNGASMTFRSKSPQRVLDEIAELHDTWGIDTFGVVDNILDLRYLRTLLPELAARRRSCRFFWEVKANLSRADVALLAAAGVDHIQPGIESLDDDVLALLRKGTTGLANLALLKWCREHGVTPEWNLLYGAPGEPPGAYPRMAARFPAYWHLQPPSGVGPIRLDRFSPYFDAPQDHGIVAVRPVREYAALYPTTPERLARISYYFEFDHADGRQPAEYVGPALEAVESWRRRSGGAALWEVARPDGGLAIIDERTGARRVATVDGWKAAVLTACDRVRGRRGLGRLDETSEVPAAALDGFLARAVDRAVLETDGEHYLSLAVHSPARSQPPSAVPPSRELVAGGGRT